MFFICFVFAVILISINTNYIKTYAEENDTEEEITFEPSYYDSKTDDGKTYIVDWKGKGELGFDFNFGTNEVDKSSVVCECSDKSVADFESIEFYRLYYNSWTYTENVGRVYFNVKKMGHVTFTITMGDITKSIDVVFVYSYSVGDIKFSQLGSNEVNLKWKKISGADGYVIWRSKADDEENYKKVATVKGGNNVSKTVTAQWGTNYHYVVVAYVNYNKDKLSARNLESLSWLYYSYGNIFETTQPTAKLKSVTSIGGNKVKIKWESSYKAQKYVLYRSETENGVYKKVFSTKNKLEYTDTVKKGATYFYYVVAYYSCGKSKPSDSVAVYVKNSVSKSKQTALSLNSYTLYTYKKNNEVYYVDKSDGKLIIYKMKNNKLKKYKTVQLPSYEIWGSFYAGTDGNFYVAVGYYNYKESTKKIVIKVLKYNSKWKLVKTCNIKGSASNGYKGVVEPFSASGVSMTMNGNTLYLATGRTMFALSDGVNHQSNIGFKINTKKMTYKTDSTYVSHSFEQIAKYKAGVLYQVDLGDAYPRCIQLSIQSDSDSEWEEYSLFKFKGETGDSVGAYIGGMEIGNNNVLVCGYAQPHYYKIKNVSGYGNLNANVFLSVFNKETGKSKVIWLTKYNPKSNTTSVGLPHIYKISENRYAVLYEIYKNGSFAGLKYVVVNESGKKIYETTYKNIRISSSSEIILDSGYLCWFDSRLDFTSHKYKLKYYRIPVKTDK